jgi:hypothetical protein
MVIQSRALCQDAPIPGHRSPIFDPGSRILGF